MTPNQTKQKHINELLESGTIMAFIDSRVEGVLVPERLRNDPELKLNFDYAFRVPDFVVREDGLIATLSFSQTPYFCAIPMEAIWQIVSLKTKKNYVYPESFPREMIQELLQQSKRGAPIPAEMIELLQQVASKPRPAAQMLQNPPKPKGFKPTLAVVPLQPETEEVIFSASEEAGPITNKEESPPAERAPLSLVEEQQDPEPSPDEPSDPPEDEPPPPPRRTTLKLIK